MSIHVGDRLPAGTLFESTGFDEGSGCPLKPQPVPTVALLDGRKVVLFAVPGAFTPLCSAEHLPGFIAQSAALRAKGVDEIVCLAVNDGFVMAEWGKAHGAGGKVRMLADGNADYVRALGLERDLTAGGMGVRSQRFALVAEDGVVRYLGVEEPGKFAVSSAAAVLAAL